MSQTVKQSTRTVTRVVRIPFHYRGNIETPVKKINVNLGDGDIGTGKDSTKFSSVTASIYCENNSRVRLHVKYTITESKFGTQKNHDGLYMEFDVIQSVSDFFNQGYQKETENGGRIKREYTPQSIGFRSSYPSASTSWKHTGSNHGYISLAASKLPDWFLARELSIKIDDGGNEYTGKGNIAVKGAAEVTIVRTDRVVETITLDDAVVVNSTKAPKMGNETKLTSFHKSIDGVLGRGYDICGLYANQSSCRDKVIDYKKLNDYQRIRKTEKNYSESSRFFGEGLREYSYKREESLGVKVSGYAFGASFSNETKKSFKEETYEKSGYKYATQNDVFVKDEYVVQGFNDYGIMMGFLTPEFLEDLNRLTADRFIEKYGTHVVLGMQVGTIFSYNMSYRQSTQKVSKASTFSNSTSISYDSSGSPKQKDDKGGSKTSSSEQVYQDLIDKKLTPAELTAFANYLKETKNGAVSGSNAGGGSGGGSGSGGGKSGWGFGIGVDYSTSMESTLLTEDQSTDIHCSARGGNAQMANLITQSNDLSVYKEWLVSCNDSNYVFADFVPGTLIPIYSLIPAGSRLTAQQVKDASDRWQKKHSLPTPSDYKRGVELVQFSTLGSSNTENISGDNDVYSKSGKPIYWKLMVDFLNFDNSHCGYSISFKVCEGGKDHNNTVLLNHVANEVILKGGCRSMSIDTGNAALNGKSHFEAEGNWVGSYHNWVDAAKEIRSSGADRIIDLNAGPFEVHLDDSGDDKGHVGARGWLKIPWVGY